MYIFMVIINVCILLCIAQQSTLVWKRSKRLEMIATNQNEDSIQFSENNQKAALTTLRNHEYEYAQIFAIGTPKQEMLAWITTYSSMLWVPHQSCNDAACGNLKFDPTDSSTFIELKGQNFTSNSLGRGIVRGKLGQDTVKIGDDYHDFVLIPRLTFGLATSVNDTSFDKNSNGLLGLSPTEYEGTGSEPFIRSAIRQGVLKEPLFTVFLHPDPVQYDHPGGSITYGSIDNTNCGPLISYANILEGGYQFDINGVSLGKFSYRRKSTAEVNFDAKIAAPSQVIAAVAKIANATYSITAKEYPVDCNAQFPDLEIEIGSSVYTIKYTNLIIKLNNNKCILALKPVERTILSSNFAFGLPFMRQYCTVFDIGKQRLGFAEAFVEPRSTEGTTQKTTGTTASPSRSTASSTTSPLNPDSTTTRASSVAHKIVPSFIEVLFTVVLVLNIAIHA